ncbi:hypothetical protein PR003_g29632 [Phytophthora rubi]|uniref:Secreted protein n=1 Tax=Phytophthora rubi TaxID=129364 RepID=A0A6A4BJJ2_9STRA|nr:hypothetical protein PR002_g31156 [Phytophthora rubi]KAE9274365.1 hypothetical protein PR003_g29632 [Phytophthora rubi]
MELFVVWLSMGARGTGATLGVTASDAGFAADMLVHSVIARCARLLRSALSRQRSLFKSKLPNGFNCLYFATILDHFPWVPFRKVRRTPVAHLRWHHPELRTAFLYVTAVQVKCSDSLQTLALVQARVDVALARQPAHCIVSWGQSFYQQSGLGGVLRLNC